MVEPGDFLRQLFAAAVAAADPAVSLARHLPAPPRGRTVVVGAGKAAASMARAVEAAWPGELSGLVVTRYGHGAPTKRIAVVEAAHPVPDTAGAAAAQRILNEVARLTPDDLVIALISGGGSALLSLPAPGLTLADKQEVNRALLRSGAGIDEMNCVRRHLSAIKGGRLAAACHPAKVVTLLISDIPGDDPLDIASGPTVPDPTTGAEALAILARYRIEVPSSVRAHLETGAGGSVRPGDERLGTPNLRMVATPLMALKAAAVLATRAGIEPLILGDAITGEAREVGRVMAGIAESVAAHGLPLAPPCVLLSGGETTVTVRGPGRGGRNVEFLLALGAELAGHPRIHALAGDTDGVDGLEEIAGAILTPDTPARAAALGLSLRASLDRNDGHGFFEALGDGVITGPTLTNVNDFRAILIV